MKNLIYILASIFLLVACQQQTQNPIYQGEHFSIYTDKVIQGEYKAEVHTPTHIISNYQSPANGTFPNFIEFKFAINGKDNELPIGINHTFELQTNSDGKIELPTLTFGEKHASETSTSSSGSIEPNTLLIIKLNASAIVKDLKKKGYFETYNGEKIYKEDFKGIYIAGNLAPLGWDFDNLAGRTDRELTDNNGDGIFEISLALNPYNPDDFTAKEWKLKHDISSYPQLQTSIPLVDALYNMSLDETEMNIENDGTFRTGEEWPGVWTRDVSYSILLAYAYTNTEVAKTSLMRKVKNNRIIQDTGTGGAWPVSSDRTTWALAAWEIYKVTGDQAWLETIYPIIKNSVDDDLKTLKDNRSKLIKGESSFLDWRKQTYPIWMTGVDIFESRCLGTNAVHARTYQILAQIAQLMGDDNKQYKGEATEVSQAINTELWMDDKGYYAQYLYGRNNLVRSPRSEALGEAFTVLFNIADDAKTQKIIASTPVVEYGIPCIYPQIPDIPPYHNNGIWPFVQAHWNWACAKAGNISALEQGLAGMNRAAALFLTNKENMVADNGDFRDTEVNSNRQLWSVAGNLSTIYRVFLGMNFELDGLHLTPMVPQSYGDNLVLKNFSYRSGTFDFTVKGNGSKIKAFSIDGKQQKMAFISKDLKGHHQIVIELEASNEEQIPKTTVKNKFSLSTPRIQINRNKLNWDIVEGATNYRIIKNGQLLETTTNNEYIVETENTYLEYSIQATNNTKESFFSEPVSFLPASSITIQAEDFASTGLLNVNGYKGSGFVELSTTLNTNYNCTIVTPKRGKYLIKARYSNGSGPDNTDNKCAIRTLTVNNQKAGVVVMPQRGKDEWSNWGYTNLIELELHKGKNTLQLSFEDYNTNMNGEVNRALLDEFILIPVTY